MPTVWWLTYLLTKVRSARHACYARAEIDKLNESYSYNLHMIAGDPYSFLNAFLLAFLSVFSARASGLLPRAHGPGPPSCHLDHAPALAIGPRGCPVCGRAMQEAERSLVHMPSSYLRALAAHRRSGAWRMPPCCGMCTARLDLPTAATGRRW